MNVSSYWQWASSRGLAVSTEDKEILGKIDALSNIKNWSEAEQNVMNCAYWFICQFDIPSTDERQREYFQKLIDVARSHFN